MSKLMASNISSREIRQQAQRVKMTVDGHTGMAHNSRIASALGRAVLGGNMVSHRDITLNINESECFFTAWIGDKPVASVQRRRVLDKQSPQWTVYDLQGNVMFTSRTGLGMKVRIAKHLK